MREVWQCERVNYDIAKNIHCICRMNNIVFKQKKSKTDITFVCVIFGYEKQRF